LQETETKENFNLLINKELFERASVNSILTLNRTEYKSLDGDNSFSYEISK
jgi:hypothetical protein